MYRALLTILLVLSSAAVAQHAQPYAGLEHRPIKALSEQQIADLQAGRGMGLALAAELNGYPGPVHVLELADALALTPEQHDHVKRLHEEMKSETILLGERLIAQEAELDRQFAARTVTPASLELVTAEIGRTQAALRAAHLRYHLSTAEILNKEQVQRYQELRGYEAAKTPAHDGSHHPRP
jgi:hypothetical protein